MPSRVLNRLLSFSLVLLLSLPAVAQFKRDSSANQKIDEAINTHYLMMELDKAEAMLKDIVDACEDQCSAGTKAKAWMYVGLVRGSGKNDMAGATEAFSTAKGIDPNVRLDEGLATPETKAAFDSTPGGSGAPVAAAPAAAAAPPPSLPPGDVPGDMLCTPETTEVATRMPIPISCQSALNPVSAVLKFKEYGSSSWKKVDMQKVGDTFQAEIPCDLTAVAGPLEWYVGAKDKSDEYIDQYGSKKQPAHFNLSESGSTDLAYPGQAPVARCASNDDCPPDFPGCGNSSARTCGDGDWGATCNNSTECKCGLACEGGTCVQAASCSSDGDCKGGESCFDGYCGVAGGESALGPHKQHWLGLTFGVDATFIGGDRICTPERNGGYSSWCLNGSDGTNYSGEEVEVGLGPTMGQLRVKLAYDYAPIDHLTIGARVGFAFVNTPQPALNATDGQTPPQSIGPFLPIDVQLRLGYTFTPLAKDGIRFGAYINGGLMEVTTSIPLPADGMAGRLSDIKIHKRGGLIGIGGGAALGYAIQPHMVLSFETGIVMLLGQYAPTVAIQPALGFTYGL